MTHWRTAMTTTSSSAPVAPGGWARMLLAAAVPVLVEAAAVPVEGEPAQAPVAAGVAAALAAGGEPAQAPVAAGVAASEAALAEVREARRVLSSMRLPMETLGPDARTTARQAGVTHSLRPTPAWMRRRATLRTGAWGTRPTRRCAMPGAMCSSR